MADGAQFKDRWPALFPPETELGVRKVFRALLEKYQEPGRYYHTLTHIKACLVQFDAVRGLLTEPPAVELALWFHDAVYQTARSDNERRSADLAAEALRQLGQGEPLIKTVRRLIRVTAHPSQPHTPDEAYMVDIDLSILGGSAQTFAEFEENIRREYHWVPLPVFTQKRGALLQTFLERDHIFHTDYFREKYGPSAKYNLERALETCLDAL